MGTKSSRPSFTLAQGQQVDLYTKDGGWVLANVEAVDPHAKKVTLETVENLASVVYTLNVADAAQRQWLAPAGTHTFPAALHDSEGNLHLGPSITTQRPPAAEPGRAASSAPLPASACAPLPALRCATGSAGRTPGEMELPFQKRAMSTSATGLAAYLVGSAPRLSPSVASTPSPVEVGAGESAGITGAAPRQSGGRWGIASLMQKGSGRAPHPGGPLPGQNVEQNQSTTIPPVQPMPHPQPPPPTFHASAVGAAVIQVPASAARSGRRPGATRGSQHHSSASTDTRTSPRTDAEIMRTPSPLRRRRRKEPVMHVGQVVDVLYTNGVYTGWMPGRIAELDDDLVRVQVHVYMPSTATHARHGPGLASLGGAGAGFLMAQRRMHGGACTMPAVAPARRVHDVWLHIQECKRRLSFPAGARTGLTGDELAALWPSMLTPTHNRATAGHRVVQSDHAVGELGVSQSADMQEVAGIGGLAAGTVKPRARLPGSFIAAAAAASPSAARDTAEQHGQGPHVALTLQLRAKQAARVAAVVAATSVSFLKSLKPGVEVDVQDSNERWRRATVTAVHTDAALLYKELGAEDTIGRGGGPVRPTVIAVDVIYAHSGVAEMIPVDSGRLAPVHTRSKEPVHTYTAHTFVDVVQIHRDPRTGEVVSRWRWAEIIEVQPRHILVRYCDDATPEHDTSLLDGGAPSHVSEGSKGYDQARGTESASCSLEWVDMVTEAYRIRAHGSMTDRDSVEEARSKQENTAFLQALAEAGWMVMTMPPDGNCLFHAVAHQVYGDAQKHAKVRSEVVDYMRQNADFFTLLAGASSCNMDFETYLSKMAQDKEWAGYVELVAMEELYDRPIVIFNSEDLVARGSLECRGIHFAGELPEEELAGVAPIRMSYHGQSHYNSIVPTEVGAGAAAGAAPVVREPVPLQPRRTSLLRAARIARLTQQAREEKWKCKVAAEAAARERVEEVIRTHIRHSSGSSLSGIQAQGPASASVPRTNAAAPQSGEADARRAPTGAPREVGNAVNLRAAPTGDNTAQAASDSDSGAPPINQQATAGRPPPLIPSSPRVKGPLSSAVDARSPFLKPSLSPASWLRTQHF